MYSLLKMLCLVCLISLALSSCSTWRKLNRTEQGAIIGTGAGAAVGGAVGEGTGAVVGGALGGVAGGVIGHEQDRDDRDDYRRRRRY